MTPVIGAALLAGLVLAPVAVKGQEPAQADSLRYRNRLAVAPYLSYSSQTHWLLGAGGGWRYKSGEAVFDSTTRPSLLAGGLFFTTEGQWSVGASIARYTMGNRWWIVAGASGAYFPLTYYGIGPYTTLADGNRMRNHQLRVDMKVARQVAPHLFIGPSYRLQAYWNLRWQYAGQIPAGLPGGTGSTSSGLGVGMTFDSRNSLFTPVRGWFLQSDLIRNEGLLGSEFGYTSLAFDGRTYRPLGGGGSTLALNLAGQVNSHDVPIQSMSMLSGLLPAQLVMRGVYLGRFRDRHQLVAQADLRLHVIGRWGVVLLGSAGNVFGSTTGLFDRVKYTGGGGLRFNINRRDPLNLRVDYVFTSFGESGLSVGAAEAF
jgi:surface antigen Omp85-like protein